MSDGSSGMKPPSRRLRARNSRKTSAEGTGSRLIACPYGCGAGEPSGVTSSLGWPCPVGSARCGQWTLTTSHLAVAGKNLPMTVIVPTLDWMWHSS